MRKRSYLKRKKLMKKGRKDKAKTMMKRQLLTRLWSRQI
jgi:hypothetical protein